LIKACQSEKIWLKSGTLFHASSEPNHIFVLGESDTLDNAKKFAESEYLKKAMQEADVSGTPMIIYLDKIEDFKIIRKQQI
jgi:hypothetical protein